MLETALPAAESTEWIEHTAEKLACLLAALPEFQHYLRSEHKARSDPQAAEIRRQISAYGLPYFPFDEIPASLAELQEQLNELPVICEYHRAETALRAAFVEVDEIITQITGLPFAENIRACGST